jgi:methylated-DNA-[protein]-cysteine S-methyltransferase
MRIFLSNLDHPIPQNRSALVNFKESFPNANYDTDPIIMQLFDEIKMLFQRKPYDFSKFLRIHVDFRNCWNRQKSIILKESQISLGYIATYASLAKACNYTHGSRVVARALAQNPFPLLIPCHRTIRSDGDLGGYQGGLEMKRKLLELEGIPCKIVENKNNGQKKYHIIDWKIRSNLLLYDFKDVVDSEMSNRF